MPLCQACLKVQKKGLLLPHSKSNPKIVILSVKIYIYKYEYEYYS